MNQLLSDDEQAFIKAKVWAGNETNAEFVCDFNCGFSSNNFNTVAAHEQYCLNNANRKLNRVEVHLTFRKLYTSIFNKNMPKMSPQNRHDIFNSVVNAKAIRCKYQRKVIRLMEKQINRLDQKLHNYHEKEKARKHKEASSSKVNVVAPCTPDAVGASGVRLRLPGGVRAAAAGRCVHASRSDCVRVAVAAATVATGAARATAVPRHIDDRGGWRPARQPKPRRRAGRMREPRRPASDPQHCREAGGGGRRRAG